MTKPDSRLPFRVIMSPSGDSTREIWTRFDDAPGSRNNYMVAGGIQSDEEAILFACAPELLQRLTALVNLWPGVECTGIDPMSVDDSPRNQALLAAKQIIAETTA